MIFCVVFRSSLARILSQVQWWSISMVKRYDVITRRRSSHFWVKVQLFQLFSTIKVHLVAKITQSAYLCVIFHLKYKEVTISPVFTWFLILGKIQDGDHCWWRHRPLPPIKYTSSCGEDQRLFAEGKIFSKYCNISKTLGGSIRPPPSLPRWGYEFACTSVRGLRWIFSPTC